MLAVADLLRGDAKGSRPVSLAGTPVTLDVTARRDDGRRVALLDRAHRVSPAMPKAQEDHAAPAGGGSGTALTRLDHAFREPLTEMIALADAMLKEPFGALGDARYRGCLAEIKLSGETMLERVGKLLDLAAVEAGSLQLEPRPLDLNDVAASCVARLQAEAARGRIVVRTSFSADLGDLEADERSVSRAAQLVIEDAIRRSAAGGQIIVSTGAAERAGVALRVRDTGAGAAARAAAPGRMSRMGSPCPARSWRPMAAGFSSRRGPRMVRWWRSSCRFGGRRTADAGPPWAAMADVLEVFENQEPQRAFRPVRAA
ncbi:sensor histidine kinase [Methylobacterium oryzae CBMB20]